MSFARTIEAFGENSENLEALKAIQICNSIGDPRTRFLQDPYERRIVFALTEVPRREFREELFET